MYLDIVVKSFNRPYYLERCLNSIKVHVKGDYSITVLDDGTPPEYLSLIEVKFPEIKILTSQEYHLKTMSIINHFKGKRNYDNQSIPVELWKGFISGCSDYFLLLEEDAWITHPISLEDIVSLMKNESLQMVKLGWNNNPTLVKGEKYQLSNEIEELIPNLPINSLFLLKPYFNNTFRIKSILNKFGIVTVKSLLPYYQLYTVTSAFFNKSYWNYIWADAESKVNESSQLLRAVKWKNERKKSKYAKTNHEYIKTSFITASVNRFKTNQFDMIRLNHYLNEAWLANGLDVMQNYPNDFVAEYLQHFIFKANDNQCTVAGWKSWVDMFKGIHREVGSIIE